MIRMKENYYIKKYYGDFVLLKRAKNKENCKKVLEKVGVYGTLREVKEAIIKEMIKDEVNRRIVRKNMSLLAYSNNKQPKEQKVYGVPSAFSIFKKILKML